LPQRAATICARTQILIDADDTRYELSRDLDRASNSLGFVTDRWEAPLEQ